MKRNLLLTIAAIALVATAAFAQQHRRGAGAGSGTPPAGPQSVLTGTVVQFLASSGTGMPSLVIQQGGSEQTLVLGPFWFLQNAKFAAVAGDSVEVTVMACSSCPSGYAVLSVKNLTSGTTVTLRNADGLPLWQSGRQGGPGSQVGQGGPASGMGGNRGGQRRGQGACNGTGPDMTRAASFTGTAVSFTGGAGAGRPTLVLATAAGEKTFLVAPYKAVVQSGLQFPAGTAFTLTAVPNVNDEWVVISLKDDATGSELVLRDPQTGLPVGGRGRH